MSENSKIEWTDRTWNPVRGCSRVSEGCRNCYAERMAARFCAEMLDRYRVNPKAPFHGFATMTPSGPRWTGRVELIESKLKEPLRWKKPCRIFVNSMSDLFHEALPDEAIAEVWRVMVRANQHQYQILTKRSGRALYSLPRLVATFGAQPHIWLGFSAEDQPSFDARWEHARRWPVGGVLFVSLEPLLGPIVLPDEFLRFIRPWVIVGGESGHGARPLHPDWARSVMDQCQAAGAPFFFKQWGEWSDIRHSYVAGDALDGKVHHWDSGVSVRVGKKVAGRLLDGREWNEFPAPSEMSQ